MSLSDSQRATLRLFCDTVVPRVERGERINVGVVVFSRPLDYLEARTGLDEQRAVLDQQSAAHVAPPEPWDAAACAGPGCGGEGTTSGSTAGSLDLRGRDLLLVRCRADAAPLFYTDRKTAEEISAQMTKKRILRLFDLFSETADYNRQNGNINAIFADLSAKLKTL